MALPELFANGYATSLASAITDAPAAGTVEVIRVNDAAPGSLQVSGQFRIIVGTGSSVEIMLVTGGVSANGVNWTVTRGAETLPGIAATSTHSVGDTVKHTLTAASIQTVTTSITAGGALTADAGRTSSVSAPVLRDFRSIKDTGYGALGGGKAFTSGGTINVATSATTFTDTVNSPFTPADAGKTLILPGAYTGGREYSTLFTYVSASQLTLTTAAVTSITNGAYQLVWDDTTPLSNALANVGSGTLWLGNDIYGFKSATITGNSGPVIMGIGATIYKIIGINTGTLARAAIFNGYSIQDGTTLRSELTLQGLTFYGEGSGLNGWAPSDQFTQSALSTSQWRNVHVYRCRFYNFNNAPLDFRDSQKVWVMECRFNNCNCSTGGRNVVNFGDNASGGALPCTEFFFIGNMLDVFLAGGVSLFQSFRASTAPMQFVITNNILISDTSNAFACVTMELNSYASGVATGASIRSGVVANNYLKQQSTSSNASTGAAIFITDNSSGNWANDPTKIEDIAIQGNEIITASNATSGNGNGAIFLWGSRMSIIDNSIWCTGTNSRCVYFREGGGTTDLSAMTQLNLSNNRGFYATNTGSTNSLIQVSQCSQVRISNSPLYSSCTTSTVSQQHGIYLNHSPGAYRYVSVADMVITGMGNNGIFADTAADVRIEPGCIIRNSNAANVVGAGGAAVQFSGAVTGFLNCVRGAELIDDRATPQMTYYVVATTASPTSLEVTDCTCKGAITAFVNTLGNFTLIHGNRTDTVVSTGSTVTITSGTPVTNTNPYWATYWLYGGSAITALTYTRYEDGTAQTIFSGNTSFDAVPVRLRPNDSFTVTATTPPTCRRVSEP